MADKDLQTILSAGTITAMNIGGTATTNKVLQKSEVETLIDASHGTLAFSNAVGAETELTGIIPIEEMVSLNADITKIDIDAFEYFIQGNKYSYS